MHLSKFLVQCFSRKSLFNVGIFVKVNSFGSRYLEHSTVIRCIRYKSKTSKKTPPTKGNV